MNAPATIARESAVHFEAKKTGFGQAQDGWSLTLRVQHDDLPAHIKDARKGTRYMVALVEIGDNEEPVQRPAVTAVEAPRPLPPTPLAVTAGAAKERNKIAQRAGILCTEQAFQKFLREKFPDEWAAALRTALDVPAGVIADYTTTELAAECVRLLCKVKSRADIKPDNVEWSSLLLAYKLWQNHPELEDA